MDALFPCCNLRQDTILHQNKLLRQTERTNSSHTQTDARGFHCCFRFFFVKSAGCSILTSLRTEPLHGFATILATDVLASRLPIGGNCCQNTHAKKDFSSEKCEKIRSSNHWCSDALQMKLVHGKRSALSAWRSIQNPQASADRPYG
jgi:hypothetical protein